MNLKCGLLNESVKYRYGHYFEEGWAKREEDWDNWFYKEQSINLISAKNDLASFQVLLKADEDFELAVTNTTAFTPRNCPIIRMEVSFDNNEKLSTRLYPEELMEDDDRIFKADILLRSETVFVRKDVGQPVWIDIEIPADYDNKKISGRVNLYVHSLFEDEVKLRSMDFSIDVADVKMPDPKDYSFYLNLWQHPSNIARKHEVTLWSDEHFKILENYTKCLADLGNKVCTVVVTEVPWSGQRCFSVKNYYSNLFEYSSIRVEKDENGRMILDFSAMDRYIEMCFKYGMDKEIEVIGLSNIWYFPVDGYGKVAEDYPDAIRIRYYDRKERKYRFFRTAEEIKEYIRAFEQHLVEKGWIDIARIMADEPHDEVKYRTTLDIMKEVAPRFKYKSALSHTSFIKKFRGQITDFVPFIGGVFEDLETYKEMKQEGEGRYLWYTAVGVHPDSSLRAHLLENRFIGWLTAYLGLEGFLRWNFTVWPEMPREQIYWNYPSWKAGETNFVYPANDGTPLLSLRYKNLKRGIQDYELIRMLKEVHPEPQKIIDRLFDSIIKCEDITKSQFVKQDGGNVGHIVSMNYSDYEEARRILLEEIEKYSK